MAILVQSNKKPSLSFPTLTGDIVTFNSQYAGLPLKSHKIAVTATQSGSGTPSPDNVRPIIGVDDITLTANGVSKTIDLDGTRYGGVFDVVSGVMRLTHSRVNLGNLSWLYDENLKRFQSSISGIKYVTLNTVPNALCDIYQVISINDFDRQEVDKAYRQNYSNSAIFIRDTDFNNANLFKEHLLGHYIVYELATPQTIQLPPCPIDTLEGVNNIWADTGETTLQYVKFG